MSDLTIEGDVLSINGRQYVAKDSVGSLASTPDGPYVIIRSTNAGVFAGTLTEHDRATSTAVLANARRLWYWDGAASLSQLAVDGVSKPKTCKFAVPVPSITVGTVIEVIPATEKAKKSVEGVAEWKA